MYAHTHMYAHIHAHMYTFMHTHTQRSWGTVLEGLIRVRKLFIWLVLPSSSCPLCRSW